MRSTRRSHSMFIVGAVLASATLTGAAADPGTADAARPATHRSSVTPDVTITSVKSRLKLSSTQLAPGGTVFSAHGRGGIEIVSLKAGYSIQDAFKDSKGLFKGDLEAVRRLDEKVVWWGGAQPVADTEEFGIDLPSGSYYAINLDRDQDVPFTVTGTPTGAALPSSDGTIKYVEDMTYQAPNHLPNKGWIQFKNTSSEPHFTDLTKVRSGTTRKTISDFLTSGANGQPAWALKEYHEALVVSPGHSFVYYLDASKGEYAELCFWPDKKTGVPHAIMGMFDISQLS